MMDACARSDDGGHGPTERHPPATRGFDAGASVRQIGLFETANGLPHGVIAVVVAFVLAAVTYPLYRLGRRR